MLASQALLLQQQRPPQRRRSYGDEHLVEVTDISLPCRQHTTYPAA